mgnify:CR=1 FL=1
MMYLSHVLLVLLIISCQTSNDKIDTSSAPSIQVIDTDFSKGQLNNLQTIELKDLVKFHGHLCDGLVVGYLGLHEALNTLYPDGIIDRTNTRIISKSPPCLTDVAIYLTGGRYQFNSFYVDNEIEGFYLVQRIDNQKAYRVSLKKNVRPKIIDSLGNLAIQKKLNFDELKKLKILEDNFSKKLLNSETSNLFEIEPMQNFNWQPKTKNDYLKTDIINKFVKRD